MPYRFAPGPFSGPAPLLHPTPPPLHTGRSGPACTGRSVVREATRVLAEQERMPAPGPGRDQPGADRARVDHNGTASEEEHHNEVVVAGRVTAEPRFRELPSGDHLATWRICVARHPSTRFRGRRVDSITCVSFDEGLHEHLRGWRLGDVVDVRGALRRRTWRGTAGPRSVCEVEATSVRFVRARRKGDR